MHGAVSPYRPKQSIDTSKILHPEEVEGDADPGVQTLRRRLEHLEANILCQCTPVQVGV